MFSLMGKVIRSLRRRGLADTWREIRSRVERPLRRYWDGQFDRECGTDTSGIIELTELTTTRNDNAECIWYQPAPLRTLRRIFSVLSVDPSRFAFVDYGAGKGRAVLVASEHPFREAIGVEFTQELHGIACKNIVIHQAGGRARCPARSVLMDAVDFEIPPGPLVCFLFTPFQGETMKRVIQRIVEHAQSNAVVIVYYGQNPDNIRRLDELRWTRQEHSVPVDLLDLQPYRLILHTSPTPSAA